MPFFSLTSQTTASGRRCDDDDNDDNICCVATTSSNGLDGATVRRRNSSSDDLLHLSSSSHYHYHRSPLAPPPLVSSSSLVVDNASSSSSSSRKSSSDNGSDSDSGNSSSNGSNMNSERNCDGHDNNDENNFDIYFRSILPQDRIPIQQLHEEWFPVKYQDDFYDDLVQNNLAGHPLHTTVAVCKQRRQRQRHRNNNLRNEENNNDDMMVMTTMIMDDEETGRWPGRRCANSFLSNNNNVNDNDENHDIHNEQDNDDEEIAGCVVGSFVEASSLSKKLQSLLISDPIRHSRLFYIMTLGTCQNYRHIGLASALIQECIIDSIILQDNNDNCGTMYLHVITSNYAAIAFYEKLGFYRVLQIENYYDINGTKYPCYLYAKYFHGNHGHRDVFKMLSRALWSVWQHVTTSVFNTAILGLATSSNHHDNNNDNNNSSHYLSLGETISVAISAATASSSSLSFSEEEIMEP